MKALKTLVSSKKSLTIEQLANNAGCWMALSQYTLIIIEGPDAEKFLQGQCTCDISDSRDNNIISGAHCNPQGRMLNSFILVQLDTEKFALRVHQSIAAQALADFQKYIVFSKAEARLEENIALIGFYQAPAGLIPSAASTSSSVSQTTFGWILAHDQEQIEVWASETQLEEISERLSSEQFSTIAMANSHQWDLLNIRKGLGDVREQTRGELLPQDINLQLTGGVSFSKGCYTGQEIVARMHYKATLKKHMYRASIESDDSILPGASLINVDTGKTVGSVIYSAPSKSGQIELLAMCKDDFTSAENALSVSPSNNKLMWLPLPYAIPK